MSEQPPAAATHPLLEVRELEGGYDEYRVLEGVSLHLDKGEVVALLGPNGHGKTTLMRMISGLLTPTRGEIRIDGESIASLIPSDIVRLGVSHIPQGDQVFPQMLVEENLLAGAYLQWAERRSRMAEVLEYFPQLKTRFDVPARVLSGGERRMLALARGLMSAPRLLIVDEPSLGLAPILRDSVYDMLRKIVESGIAMLLVEEKASHLHGLANRIYVMESGKIIIEGSADDVLNDPDLLLQAYVG